jgi:23S rRNA (cytosine1962-C5)-methyltransferase
VAAALGGAARVVSVDVSARALERARRNFELNGLPLGPHRFVRDDVPAFVARLVRRNDRFDVAVLDPPSFATGERHVFRMSRDFAPLLSNLLRILTPGGRLLAVTNHLDTSRARLRRLVHHAARQAGRELAQVKDLPSPSDCPSRLGEPYPSKSVLVTLS